jgi:hypothetical protein
MFDEYKIVKIFQKFLLNTQNDDNSTISLIQLFTFYMNISTL